MYIILVSILSSHYLQCSKILLIDKISTYWFLLSSLSLSYCISISFDKLISQYTIFMPSDHIHLGISCTPHFPDVLVSIHQVSQHQAPIQSNLSHCCSPDFYSTCMVDTSPWTEIIMNFPESVLLCLFQNSLFSVNKAVPSRMVERTKGTKRTRKYMVPT